MHAFNTMDILRCVALTTHNTLRWVNGNSACTIKYTVTTTQMYIHWINKNFGIREYSDLILKIYINDIDAGELVVDNTSYYVRIYTMPMEKSTPKLVAVNIGDTVQVCMIPNRLVCDGISMPLGTIYFGLTISGLPESTTKNINIINTPNINIVNQPGVNVLNQPVVSVGNTPNVVIMNEPNVKVINLIKAEAQITNEPNVRVVNLVKADVQVVNIPDVKVLSLVTTTSIRVNTTPVLNGIRIQTHQNSIKMTTINGYVGSVILLPLKSLCIYPILTHFVYSVNIGQNEIMVIWGNKYNNGVQVEGCFKNQNAAQIQINIKTLDNFVDVDGLYLAYMYIKDS